MVKCDTCYWHFNKTSKEDGICANVYYDHQVVDIKKENRPCNDYRMDLDEWNRLIANGTIKLEDYIF